MLVLFVLILSTMTWAENLRWFNPYQGVQDCIIYNQFNCSQFDEELVPVRKLLGNKQVFFGLKLDYEQDYTLSQQSLQLNQMTMNNHIRFLGETLEGSFFGLEVQSWGSPLTFEETRQSTLLQQSTVESAHLILAQDISIWWKSPFYLTFEAHLPIMNSRGIWEAWTRFDIPKRFNLDLGFTQQNHRYEILDDQFTNTASYYLRSLERTLHSRTSLRWNRQLKTSAQFKYRELGGDPANNSVLIYGQSKLARITQDFTWQRLKNETRYEFADWYKTGLYQKHFINHESTIAWTPNIQTMFGGAVGTMYGESSNMNLQNGWWGSTLIQEQFLWMNGELYEWYDVKMAPMYRKASALYQLVVIRRQVHGEEQQRWLAQLSSHHKHSLGTFLLSVNLPLNQVQPNAAAGIDRYENGYGIRLETTSQF